MGVEQNPHSLRASQPLQAPRAHDVLNHGDRFSQLKLRMQSGERVHRPRLNNRSPTLQSDNEFLGCTGSRTARQRALKARALMIP